MIDTLPHQQIACFAVIFGLSTRWSASGRHCCGAGHTCSTSSWIGTRKSPPTTWRQWVRPHRSSPTSPGSPPWAFAEPVVAMLEARGCSFSALSLHIPICHLLTNYRVTPSVLTTQQYATRDPFSPQNYIPSIWAAAFARIRPPASPHFSSQQGGLEWRMRSMSDTTRTRSRPTNTSKAR